MRLIRLATVGLLAAALLPVSVPVAAARPVSKAPVPPVVRARVTAPRAPRSVTVGVVFEATGSVTPSISADDTNSAVTIQVFKWTGRMAGWSKVSTASAGFTGPVGTKSTGYSASLSLADAGSYGLAAVFTRAGKVVARSDLSVIVVKPAFRVSAPHVAKAVVPVGTTFVATGSVSPTSPAGDTLGIRVFKWAGRSGWSQVATVSAALTPGDVTTAYGASLSLPEIGNYALVAVLKNGDAVVASSEMRPMVAAPIYRVSTPRAGGRASVGATITATGSITPTVPADGTTVAVKVFAWGGARAGWVATATAAGQFTGPVGTKSTGYAASYLPAAKGWYELVAVVSKSGTVLGTSGPTLVQVR